MKTLHYFEKTHCVACQVSNSPTLSKLKRQLQTLIDYSISLGKYQLQEHFQKH